MANNIAKNGPNAVKNSKKAINEGLQLDIDSGIKLEEELFGECFNEDQAKRMKNFLKS